MWITFLGKHIKPSLAEIVLALISSRICIYQFCNRHDSLTLCNARTVTFKLVAVRIGACDLLSCIFVLVICIRHSYSLFVVYSSFIRYYSFSYFVHCSIFHFVSFSFEFWFDCCSKKKEQFWPWTLFRYFDPVKQKKYPLYLLPVQHHHLESINIIQQTPPTLS
jgi:hypothetical protein